MTRTINGIGSFLSGTRHLTKEEIDKWVENFPYMNQPVTNALIATESAVIFWIPIYPVETIVYFMIKSGTYQIVYYPAGKGNVYWEHVKGSPSFYIFPILIIIGFLYMISSQFIK